MPQAWLGMSPVARKEMESLLEELVVSAVAPVAFESGQYHVLDGDLRFYFVSSLYILYKLL